MKRQIFLFIAALLAFGAGLHADTIQSPTYTISVGTDAGSNAYSQPGSYSYTSANGSAMASVAAFPDVLLSASATSAFFGAGSASASITYYFEIVGANPGDHIPVLIAANLSTDAAGKYRDPSSGDASIIVTTQDDQQQASVSCGNVTRSPGSCNNPDWSGTLAVDYVGGYQASVTVSVTAFANADTGHGDAYADPLIYVNPSFANAADYSVALSPGVGNGLPSAVPEPASLLLVGSVLLGAGMLRKRR